MRFFLFALIMIPFGLKADNEPTPQFEFWIYKTNGDSIKVYSQNSSFTQVKSIDFTKKEWEEKLKLNGNSSIDSLVFFKNVVKYRYLHNPYGKEIIPTTSYRYYNSGKIALKDVKHIKLSNYKQELIWSYLKTKLLEKDSVWSNTPPDTSIYIEFDEMYYGYFFFHDYYGKNHSFYKQFQEIANQYKTTLRSFFEKGISPFDSKNKEFLKLEEKLKSKIEIIRQMEKVVEINLSSC